MPQLLKLIFCFQCLQVLLTHIISEIDVHATQTKSPMFTWCNSMQHSTKRKQNNVTEGMKEEWKKRRNTQGVTHWPRHRRYIDVFPILCIILRPKFCCVYQLSCKVSACPYWSASTCGHCSFDTLCSNLPYGVIIPGVLLHQTYFTASTHCKLLLKCMSVIY